MPESAPQSSGRSLQRATRLAAVALLALPAAPLLAQDDTLEGWPREIETDVATVILYQPQIDSFEGDKLTARAAVAARAKDAKEQDFGAVWIEARIQTDRDDRMVDIIDVKVPTVRFPEATEKQQQQLAALIERELPTWDLDISLDRLLTSLDEAEGEGPATDQLETKPPVILFVEEPAVLITIDGAPQLQAIEGSDLMRVVNTPFTIALDPSTKKYYLDGGEPWYVADEVAGPWSPTESVPQDVAALRPPPEESPEPAAADEEAVPEDDRIPKIVIATEPTELIVSDGEPSWTPIAGVDLLYMSNSESDVLLEIGSQYFYIVLSGRWYRSKSFDGPWTFVAADELPPSFAEIPPESDMSHLLVFVAGTDDARDAVLDNQIPQTSAIRRDEAKLTVTYDGNPEFEKIEGTEMKYAVNTSYSVIQVGTRYWACHEAVWFEADSPLGPWVVADEVPAEIYTIPPSVPVYNVKYVYIYDSTPEVVYVGYLPGYTGSYVYHTTVVYGTGYVYPSWYGTYYYPRPCTWGFHVRWNPWWGWSFGISWSNGPFRISIGVGGWHGGWWGPRGWRGYRHGYRRGYHHGYRAGYRAGARAGYRNNNIYNRPENKARNVPSTRPAQPSREAKAGGRPNDVYTDKSGNVYRKGQEGGWERREGNDWKKTDPGSGPATADRSRPDSKPSGGNASKPATGGAKQPSTGGAAKPSTGGASKGSSYNRSQPSSRGYGGSSSLDRSYNSRQRGSSRTQSYQRSRGGGMRGGGRRR